MKTCPKCKKKKEEIEFHKDNQAKDGLTFYCKDCRRILRRESDLKKKYGINIITYNQMKLQQQGRCDICGQKETQIHPFSKKVKPLSVDHSHATGKIRKLLCTRCNLLLGVADDSIKLLQKCINYLEEN